MHPQFDYHFCLPFLLVWMVVIWCSSWVPPKCILSNFQRLFFWECYQIWKCISELHSSNIHVSGRLFSGDLLASVLPVLPLLGGQVPTFICYIYTYIFLKKTFWKNSGRNGKIGRSAQLSHQLSYHFYWFPRISTTLRKTWRNRMAIYWHTSPKVYTSIYSEYLSCLYQKMLDWFNSPCIHPSLSKDAWTWACLILDCQWRGYLKLL